MARRLKVFCTPAGFHDAYVAAPSRKAALAAWGSDADLFARGVAQEVTDPALMEEPLARPGEVVKRSRGSAAEQLAAAPAVKRAAKGKVAGAKAGASGARPAEVAKPRREPKPKPKPSRAALERAEAAAADADARHAAARRALGDRLRALERERTALLAAQEEEAARLERARMKAAAAYQEAVERWRG